MRSVSPLLTQACLACCKDRSQTPRATGPTGKGAQVPLGPLLLMWPLQLGVPGPLGILSVAAPLPASCPFLLAC